jgi:large subunit ribosomal protein L21
MYAIVEIAGQQFKVEEGEKIFVHHLEAEDGKTVEFDHVLLLENNGKVTIGEPVIKDALVEGKVLEQLKGDKVIVFKKKRKKGYRVRNGHRQYFTKVEIVSIKEKAVRKASPKEETVEVKAAVKEKETVEVKAAVKKKPVAAEKIPSTKKPAVKKTPASKVSASKGSEKTAVKKTAAKTVKSEKTTGKKSSTRKPAKGEDK